MHLLLLRRLYDSLGFRFGLGYITRILDGLNGVGMLFALSRSWGRRPHFRGSLARGCVLAAIAAGGRTFSIGRLGEGGIRIAHNACTRVFFTLCFILGRVDAGRAWVPVNGGPQATGDGGRS